MNSDPCTKSWFERLAHLLTREPQDREQLIELLREAQQNQLLKADALAMIEGVLNISEMQVRDIMIPRPQMIVIYEKQTITEFMPTVVESGHSRFPVMGDDHSEVLGILHAKDLLAYQDQKKTFDIKDILRPAVIVPESKRLDILLKEFRMNRNHMAIVVDEYGNIAGCVTIEDIIEQIVGEIEDEFDFNEEANIKQLEADEYVIKAHTPIDEFNTYFKANFSDQEFDTLGGLVLDTFGHVPKRGETTDIKPYKFTVLNADNRRVRLLKVNVGSQA